MDLHILDLPDETLTRILYFIPHLQLICTIGKVCRRLAALSRQGTLWRNVDIDMGYSDIDKRMFLQNEDLFKAQFTQLHTLSLMTVDSPDLLVKEALDNSPKLSNLKLILCTNGTNEFIVTDDFFIKLQEKGLWVKKMCLIGVNLKNVNISTYKLALSRMTHLNLAHSDLRDNELMALADYCHNLSHLHFLGCRHFTDQAFVYLLKQRCKTLRNLVFGGSSLSGSSCETLALCQHLEELGVHSAEAIERSGLLAISQLEGLNTLELFGQHYLSDEDLCVAFGNGHLKNLNCVGISQISDEGVKSIAENCPKLKEIRLHHSMKLTHMGIAELLNHCPGLCKLDFYHCQSLDVNQLPWAQLTKLRSLGLIGLSNSEESNDLLKLALYLGPDTIVLDYWGERVGHSELSAYMRDCAEHKCRVRQRYLDQWHLLRMAGMGAPLSPTPKAYTEDAENGQLLEQQFQDTEENIV